MPRHVSVEPLKLYGIRREGKEKMLVIEKAKTPPKAKTINGVNQKVPKKGDIALFSDSIPRGMNIKEINRQIQGGGIHVRASPGAKTTQLNHYVTPTLEEYSYDAAMIHVSINNILRSKHYDELDKLPGNIIKLENTCLKSNIEKIYISDILPSTKTNINVFYIKGTLTQILKSVKIFAFI